MIILDLAPLIKVLKYSDVIATLAFLISVATAALSIKAYWNSRPKLEIFYNKETSISFLASPLEKVGYDQKARCCLWLELANKASAPISVSRIYLRPHDRGKTKYVTSPQTKVQGEIFPLDLDTLSVLHVDKQLIPPLKIDAYTIEFGFAYFLIDKPRAFSAELIVETPWKTFRRDVDVSVFKPPSEKPKT